MNLKIYYMIRNLNMFFFCNMNFAIIDYDIEVIEHLSILNFHIKNKRFFFKFSNLKCNNIFINILRHNSYLSCKRMFIRIKTYNLIVFDFNWIRCDIIVFFIFFRFDSVLFSYTTKNTINVIFKSFYSVFFVLCKFVFPVFCILIITKKLHEFIIIFFKFISKIKIRIFSINRNSSSRCFIDNIFKPCNRTVWIKLDSIRHIVFDLFNKITNIRCL